MTITELPTKTASGSQYVAVEDSTSTGKATVNDVVGASTPVQNLQTGVGRMLNDRLSVAAGSSETVDLTAWGVYLVSTYTKLWVVYSTGATGTPIVGELNAAANGPAFTCTAVSGCKITLANPTGSNYAFGVTRLMY